MFQGAKVVKQEGMPCDSEMLIRYFTETLGGNVTAEQYGTLTGEGRIKVLAADSEEAHRYEETGRTEPTGEKREKLLMSALSAERKRQRFWRNFPFPEAEPIPAAWIREIISRRRGWPSLLSAGPL